ncbi:E3 ubiquitin-protein ligase TRIM45-like [Oculina patagonica]
MDVRELFQNLKKEAECPLCLETVNEPKTLPCLHSFCLLCLDKHAGYARRQLQTTIKCPVCLTDFQIPEGDTFGGLPTSFHLNRLVDVLALGDDNPQSQTCSSCEENNTATCYCFDCSDFFCNACAKVHNQMKISRHHRSVLIQNLKAQDVEEMMQRPVMCGEKYHEKESLEYYCQECNVCACQKCVILNHNRHAMLDMQEAAEEQKMQITEVVEQAKTKIDRFEKQLVQEIAVLNRSREDTEAARNKLRTTTEELVRIVKEHEMAMVAKLNEIDEERQRRHAVQQERQLLVKQLKSSAEYCEAVLQRNLSFEILQQQAVVERCKTLLNEEAEANVKSPKKPLYVNYVINEKVVEDVRRAVLGEIVVSYSDSSQSVAEGKGLEEAEVGIEANFTITTKDFEGKQCYYENDQLKITIKTSSGEDLVDKVINDNKDGEYTVTYTPHCADEHTVVITLNDQPLMNSPWCFQVSPHQYKFEFQFGLRSFGWDASIAFNETTDTIAVADNKNWRVQLVSSRGKYIAEFVFDQHDGKPTSVAFTRSGEILVIHARRISLFTERLQFIKRITNDQVKEPLDLSVAHDGRIIVTNLHDKTVKVLSSDAAEVLLTFTTPDCNNWRPRFPVYHQGMFFVCYPGDCCIKVFNNEGEFLYDIGNEGSDNGELRCPYGLAIDKFNSLIVCDRNNKRLQVFTLQGKFLNLIDQNEPHSIAASSSGDLFVANNWKGTHIDVLH